MDKWDKMATKFFKEMFRRVGEEFPNEELTNDKDWYKKRSWTEKQQEDFKKWMKKELKKTFPDLSARKVEWEAGIFLLSYGWTTKEAQNG